MLQLVGFLDTYASFWNEWQVPALCLLRCFRSSPFLFYEMLEAGQASLMQVPSQVLCKTQRYSAKQASPLRCTSRYKEEIQVLTYYIDTRIANPRLKSVQISPATCRVSHRQMALTENVTPTKSNWTEQQFSSDAKEQIVFYRCR
jgi:hypothetical protein